MLQSCGLGGGGRGVAELCDGEEGLQSWGMEGRVAEVVDGEGGKLRDGGGGEWGGCRVGRVTELGDGRRVAEL